MTNRPALLRQIHTEARPYVEQLVELNVVFTGFRKLATDNGLDWGQIKALLRAEIEDGEAGGSEKVDRIIQKAEYAGEYAALLGLGTSNMNERNSISADLPPHDEDGVIIEEQKPAVSESEPAEAGQEGGAERPGVDDPTLQTSSSVAPPLRSIAQGDVIAPAPGAGSLSAKGDDISLADLRDMLDYSPETGEFRWKVAKGRIQPGDTTGSDNGNGYLIIWIDGQRYRAHRLAWFYHYGQWPTVDLDHVNGDPSDNRIENLRECTDRENSRNRGPWRRNQSGLKGVHAQNGKWRAQITSDGEKIDLGTFPTKEAAHAAYCDAARKYHGDFARTAASPTNTEIHREPSNRDVSADGEASSAAASQGQAAHAGIGSETLASHEGDTQGEGASVLSPINSNTPPAAPSPVAVEPVSAGSAFPELPEFLKRSAA